MEMLAHWASPRATHAIVVVCSRLTTSPEAGLVTSKNEAVGGEVDAFGAKDGIGAGAALEDGAEGSMAVGTWVGTGVGTGIGTLVGEEMGTAVGGRVGAAVGVGTQAVSTHANE